MLPKIFTEEHMMEIMQGGNDLKSPKTGKFPHKFKEAPKQKNDEEMKGLSESKIDIRGESF